MDMLAFLMARGITVHYTGLNPTAVAKDKHISNKGTWAQMTCPLCGGEKLWLGYNVRGRYFNCYNHGYASKWQLFRAWFPTEDTKMLLQSIDDVVVVEEDEAHSGMYLPPSPTHLLSESKLHWDYLKSRGLNPQLLQARYGVRALCTDTEWKYQNRVFFPVANKQGRPVSWLTRTILPQKDYRYLTAPHSNEAQSIKTLLYGEQFVTHFDTVIICEGVFDALRVGRNALATFGKNITNEQFDKIKQYQRRIICFDSEVDTQEQAKQLAIRLQAFPGITDNVCLDAPDPATASTSEISALLKYAELI